MARRASITPATTFAFTEGAPSGTTFLGTVIDNFNASCILFSVCNYTVTLDMGDGSPPATVPVTGYPCLVGLVPESCVDVNVIATYAEEGAYTIVATVTTQSGSTVGTLTNTASVGDAPLTASGLSLTASGGVINGTVATVSDADPGGTATDYAATINWGDGSPTDSGAIVASGSGGFTVSGTHTYANPTGSYNVNVSIADGGGSSATATTTVAPTPPSQPAVAVAFAGDTTATVYWTPPTNDGGSPIIGYTVQTCTYVVSPPPGGMPVRAGTGPATIKPNGGTPLICGNPTVTVGPSATSALVTGLANDGGPYLFSVVALNAAGASGPKRTFNQVAPDPATYAPSTFRVTPGDGSVTLSWAPPTQSGFTSTGYFATLVDSAGDIYTQRFTDPSTLSATFTGLTNGTSYTAAVMAVGITGSTYPAATSMVTPQGLPTATPTDTPTNTPTETPTATNTPTDTLVPTNTDTATNTPTNTPLPTNTATATSTAIPPSLVSSRASGSYKTTVTMTGTNFGATEPISLYWDSTSTTPLTHTTSNAVGAFVTTLSVPQAISGTHTIIALGQNSYRTASAPIRVTPLSVLLPARGAPGTHSTLVGFGLGANESVKAYWTPGNLLVGTGTASALGTTDFTITVPLSPTGAYRVYALGQTSKAAAASTFVVTPTLRASPTSGAPGAPVTLTGVGYGPSESVPLRWDCAASSCASTTVLGTPLTTVNGAFSLTVTIPATATAGTHSIGGQGGKSGAFAATTVAVA